MLFGEAVPRRVVDPPAVAHLAGLAMHHVLHARVCIERGRLWQAEYWISTLRDHAVELAALRHGVDASYAKGAHLLPAVFTDELARSLVGVLEPAVLRRALAAVACCFHREMREHDPRLAEVMEPSFRELAGSDAVAAADPA